MRLKRTFCLIVALIMVMAMMTTTADAASFNSKPTGVKAKCVNGATVSVSCKAKKGADGYCFYYSTKKKGKYKLAVTSGSRSARVGGLTAGKTYYFKVQAYKGTDIKTYSKMSKAVKCKTVLKTPSIAVTDKCDCKVALRINGAAGAQGYKIYRSVKKKKGFKLVKVSSTNTCIDDTGLKASTKYYYKVRGYSGKYHSKYSKVITVTTAAYIDGNASKYDPAASKNLVALNKDCARLEGRNLLFWGSSITYGSASGGISFADYVGVRNGAIVKKNAQGGTNLAKPSGSTNDSSYVSRLARSDAASFVPDIFICQLSLNDSLNGIGIGALPSVDFSDLSDDSVRNLYNNATTVAGAIAYVDAYAHYYWPDCQVVFFTVRNNGYNSQYSKMRDKLFEAQSKYGNFKIIDMWSRSELTNVTGDMSLFRLYMADNNHPKKAGYLYQWTPVFESNLIAWMPEMPQWTVQWKKGDDVLETDSNLRRGQRLSYDSAAPTKTEDDDYTYEFIGWVNEIPGSGDVINDEDNVEIITAEQLNTMVVTGDATYYAVFRAVPKVQVSPSSEDGGEDSTGTDGEQTDGSSEQTDGPDVTSVIQTLFRAA